MNLPNRRNDALSAGETETTTPQDQLPALGVIGGLLTVKQLASFYGPLLDLDTSTDVESRHRFIAPHARGIGEIAEVKEKALERAYKIHSRVGKKILWVGHSLGGLIATEVAMEAPEITAGVVSLGGVHDGYRHETPASLALRYLLGNPPQAVHLKHDSDFMEEHREKMANHWPEGVPFETVSTLFDYLIVPPQGFGIKLALNNSSADKLVIPRMPALSMLTRRGLKLHGDTSIVQSLQPIEHVYLARSQPAIDHVKSLRSRLGIPSPNPLGPPITQGHTEAMAA